MAVCQSSPPTIMLPSHLINASLVDDDLLVGEGEDIPVHGLVGAQEPRRHPQQLHKLPLHRLMLGPDGGLLSGHQR